MFPYPLIAVALTGFAAGIGQVLVLRELLVLFYGNELSTGLVLTSWLLWTSAGSRLGGRFSSSRHINEATLGGGLLLLAAAIPLTLLWIRAARPVWGIPLGELVSPALMLTIALTATSCFCLVSGFMFTAAWKAQLSMPTAGKRRPILVYGVEALGSAAGGLCFYFVLLPHVSQFMAAWLTSAAILAVGVTVMKPWQSLRRLQPVPAALGIACLALVAAMSLNSERLDKASHRWQWGDGLVAVRDTPYNNLALLQDADQFSLFGNGLWFFSLPDPQTAEYAVHPALLQHPRPQRVLVIGGGAVGLVAEILKHPGITHVDVVEPDPKGINLLEAHLPAPALTPLSDPRVRIHHRDAGSFVRRSNAAYDVILSTLGDPMNAEMNRFYTVEFFQRIRRLLGEEGVFSFAISAGDILGSVQARLLRSCYEAAGAVFPRVLVFLADSARFLAANEQARLVSDPHELAARISKRKLDLQYVREDSLLDFLSPMRLSYVRSLIAGGSAGNPNRDFTPGCYFNNLLLWASQLHPRLEEALVMLSAVNKTLFWVVLGALFLLLAVFSWAGWLRFDPVCRLSVMVMGGAQLAFEIILVLAFQVLEGFVYRELALIVTFFMAGAALGAGIESWLDLRISSARRWLVAVQGAFALFVLAALGILMLMHSFANAEASTPVVFSLLAGTAGLLGGLHFALAVTVISGSKTASAVAAGRIYAVDLAGAALGSVLASLFILPLYGIPTAIAALSVVSFGSALAVAGAK